MSDFFITQGNTQTESDPFNLKFGITRKPHFKNVALISNDKTSSYIRQMLCKEMVVLH